MATKYIHSAKRYNPGELVALVQKRQQELSYLLFKRKVCRDRYRIDKSALWHRRKKCAWRWCRERDIDKLTVDHIVPISVAYYLNWTVKQTRSYGNIQLLCQRHHATKDSEVHQLQREAYRLTGGIGEVPRSILKTSNV